MSIDERRRDDIVAAIAVYGWWPLHQSLKAIAAKGFILRKPPRRVAASIKAGFLI